MGPRTDYLIDHAESDVDAESGQHRRCFLCGVDVRDGSRLPEGVCRLRYAYPDRVGRHLPGQISGRAGAKCPAGGG